jgi:hypothetical protein
MRTSEQTAELDAAFIAAQGEMGGAEKDSANPFFKSKYADLTSVLKVVKPAFAMHGLGYSQWPVNRPDTGIPGVLTRIHHISGQWMEAEFYATPVKNDPQQIGSVITYLRRYAIQSICGIPAVDDDAEATMLRNEPVVDQATIDAGRDAIRELLFDTNTDEQQFCDWLGGVDSVDNLPAELHERAMTALQNKQAKMEAVNANQS